MTRSPEALAWRNVDLVGFVALLKFLRSEFLVALQARLGFGLTRLRVGSNPFEFAFERLGERILLALLLGESLRLLFEPGRVIALPWNAVTAIELENPFGDVVEEVAVMGHRDHGAGVFLEEMLQPSDRLRIQMIGRLIEQQHVGLREQQSAQGDPALFPARQLADHGFPRRQAQRVGGNFEFALEFPTADRIDLVLHLRLLFHELGHLIVGHRFSEAVADGIEAIDQTLYVADPLADHLAHRLGLVEQRLLGQIAHLDARLRAGLTLDFLVRAGHDLEQGRFARSVQAEHADFRAGKKTQADIAQNDALGRHDLADPVHGVNELSHVCVLKFR